jgi:outer membrane immunogenic protein
MIRKLLLASVGAIALTGSALAADLPSRAPPPVYLPPVPIFTWTGIYLGGQIGYAWASGNNRYSGFDPLTAAVIAPSIGQKPNGVIGGANVGYNYQINQWVLGLEGTVDGTSLSNTGVGFSDVFLITAHSKSDIQGSIRGRVGIAWDRVLIFATGGAAFAGFNTTVSGAATVPAGFPNAGQAFAGSTSISTTRVGWTIGGGIQYAVTNNWSVKAEYRYTDFGTISNALFSGQLNSVFPGASIVGNRKVQQNQVQVGFDYKFDLFTPQPVVAKY